MERDQFLGRVRTALRDAVLPDVSGPKAAPPIRFDDPVARFVEMARAVAANVVRVDGPEHAVEAVAYLPLGEGSGQSFISWDGLDEVVPGWDDLIAARGWVRVDASVGEETRYADHERVGAVKLGITTADFGIAATGSVFLNHGPGRPRSASLTVEHHVVLLPAERIVSSLDEVLSRVDWSHTSNVVAITGPSLTGDIDGVRTRGVHGPRHLHVVLID